MPPRINPVMSVTVGEICAWIESWAPVSWAEEGDSVGLQFGSLEQRLTHLGLALELTPAVAEWVLREGVDALLTHHPVFFRPLRRLREEDPWEGLILRLIRRGCTVVSYHTNLDAAPGGVSDLLAEALGIRAEQALRPVPGQERAGLGRVGELEQPLRLSSLAERLHQLLRAPVLMAGPDREVKRVALCAGSGWSLWPEVLSSGAEVFITGEVKHHIAREAEIRGLGLLATDHWAMENYFWRHLSERLRVRFPDLRVSFFEDRSPFRTLSEEEDRCARK